METMKSIFRALLRTVGVLALAAGLLLLLFKLEEKGPVERAEILFAGTENDADCAVLFSRDTCVVIDTGEEEDGPHILELLREQNVEEIDCLILTHPDKDHIGSAAQILDAFPVKMILMPYYMKESDRFKVLQEKMRQMNAPVMTLSRSREFVFGDLKVRVFPPEEISYKKDNNYSLITLVEHGNVRMLFAGDAQRERLEEMDRYRIDPVDLYKVPHHGRESKKSVTLIHQLKPAFAVITAPLADPDVSAALAEEGTDVIYTVPGTDCRLESDGNRLVKLN